METGTLIKKYRTDKKLTQKQLGELCTPPIAESTIRRYELGKLNPKFETVQKIADALDVPLCKFYSDKADFQSMDFVIETCDKPTSDEQRKRIMHYFAKLNTLGLDKIERQLEELMKNQKYLK